MKQKEKKVHPLVKTEILAKRKILENDRLVGFLKSKNIKCFSDQSPKEKFPSFDTVLKNIKIEIIRLPNQPWYLQYKFKNSHGEVRVYLHGDFRKDRPTFIYHHGIGEIYHPLQIKLIFEKSFIGKFNFFSIKTSHHENIKQIINNYINNFTNMTCGVAGSLLALDEVVNLHKSICNTPTVACGISLGGIVTSLHYYFYGTCDFYFPLAAFPDLPKILLNSTYKPFVDNQDLLGKNKSFLNSFEVPNPTAQRHAKIFPILGKYDATVNYQDAKNWWRGQRILSLDTGHSSIFVKGKEIQSYILSKINLR